ncbi:MAG: TrbG/VirB9 family P-type conjugative transfer protein [Erythrobacter sp.]|nr:TrbG/VirB9 family P-type conjugative transfer protein [Erythrobacter sp.]
MILRPALPLLLALAPLPAMAQVVPDLELDNPRLQTVHFEDGQEVLLTVMPETGVTVMLERGETIQRIAVGDDSAFDVRVSPEGNSFLVLPRGPEESTRMQVQTDRRAYPFTLRTGAGLTAAYLVRFLYGELPAAGGQRALAPVSASAPAPGAPLWGYRMRGDAVVEPQAISDDASRTYITYGPDQALPAVFAIGATGEEELVNGQMRGDVFVIDRVYAELVFRLDDERATARRNANPDSTP